MTNGFILLHRKIIDNWIFQRSDYFHWFIIMLFEANFKDKNNYLFNGNLITIERGSFITSYEKLAYKFPNSSIKKVRTFLSLLKKDKIIETESLIKATKITICKYDDYQTQGQAKGKQRASKGQAKGNNRKKDKERIKKDKEYIYNSFYDAEIKINEKAPIIEKYLQFVDFLFGENETEEKLHSILSIANQLTYKQFEKINQLKLENKKSIAEILLKMENDPKYTKGKKSLNLTLQNWLKNTFVK